MGLKDGLSEFFRGKYSIIYLENYFVEIKIAFEIANSKIWEAVNLRRKASHSLPERDATVKQSSEISFKARKELASTLRRIASEIEKN